MNNLTRAQFLASAVMFFFLTLAGGAMAIYVYSDPGIPSAIQFIHAAQVIKERYSEEVDLEQMSTSARDAIFDKLDRYSSYVPERGFDHFREEREGAYVGIGVSITSYESGLLVADVKEDGPADSAGILAGDIILGTDSVRFAEFDNDPTLLLRGQDGTDVRVVVFRPATDDTLTLKITRHPVPLRSVPFAGMTPNNALYLRVDGFAAGTSAEIKWAIDSLLADGKEKATGVILDLRGNPGGMLYEAYSTAALFFDTSTFLVGTKGRSHWDEESYYAGGHDITDGLPMVVLCDRGSASASEIVSGALQKAKRAKLVGDTTFGKGLVQGFTRFPEGDGIRLTISRYYFADGQFLNELDSVLHDRGTGLVPDYYFTDHSELANLLDLHQLLLLFAARYQDTILAPNRTKADDSILISRLESFAEKNGFHYESKISTAINDLSLIWQERHGGEKLPKSLSGLVDAADARDRGEYFRQSERLLSLLRRYAVNRRLHEHHTYTDVIVKEDAAILFAETILAQETNDGK